MSRDEESALCEFYCAQLEPCYERRIKATRAPAERRPCQSLALMPINFLPAFNAVLNATTGVLIVTGFIFIRRKRVAAHRACMLGAVSTSCLFLVSYVVYHVGFGAGVSRFMGSGWV